MIIKECNKCELSKMENEFCKGRRVCKTCMNWDNYGKYNGELCYGWDIDHIIPISSAINEGNVLSLNHYTNLQPLCSKVNRDIKRNIIL